MKYDQLDRLHISKTKWKKIEAAEPNYLFLLFDGNIGSEYQAGYALNKLFPINSMGVTTARDALVVGFSGEEVMARMRRFVSLSVEGAREEFSLGKDAIDWLVYDAQKDVNESGCTEEGLVDYSYRLFDNRFAYYTGESRGLMCRPRKDVMQHLAQPQNKALCFIRRSREDVISIFFCNEAHYGQDRPFFRRQCQCGAALRVSFRRRTVRHRGCPQAEPIGRVH
jgi:hypothetical protein